MLPTLAAHPEVAASRPCSAGGLYEPFLRDWHAAFGSEGLLVIKTEDLIDDPLRARQRLLDFLGLPGVCS